MALNRTNPLPRTMATVLENLADNPEFGDVYTKTQTDDLIGAITPWLSEPVRPFPPFFPGGTGSKGQIAYDLNYIYFCIDTDTWVRVTRDTWA